MIGEDCYQITPATNTQTGSVWYADQVDLSQPLDLQFLLNLGNNDSNGADGICFVLQSVGTEALGQSGGGIGFLGEDFQPAFAIEFDTYQNADFGDPIGDHIAMVSNGSVNHLLGTAIAGPVQADAFNPNIEDGEDHQGRVTWDPVDQVVRVYFDCELRLEGFIDLVGDIFNGQNQVYFGFTAGTGGANNLQTVCLEENILGSAEQSFVCPGAELQLNVPSPSGAATWSPGDYLSDSLSASPVATPPEGLTEPLIYVAQYQDNCGADIVDTIQLNVEVMTAEVLGVTNLTCDNPSLSLTAESNFPGPLDYTWTAVTGSISGNSGLAEVDEAGSYEVLVSFQEGLCEAAAAFAISLDTATYTGDFPESVYLTCDDPTVVLEGTSLSSPDAVISWTTTFGEILGAGPSVTALVEGQYIATITNPTNGCAASYTVEVADASEVPDLFAGSVEPLTCLNPGQPRGGCLHRTLRSIWRQRADAFGVVDQHLRWHTKWGLPFQRIAWPHHQCGRHLPARGGMAGNRLRGQRYGDGGRRPDFGVDISSITFPQHPDRRQQRQERQLVPLPGGLPDVEALAVLTNYALRVYNRWGQVVYTNAGDGFASGVPIRWYGNGGNGEPWLPGTTGSRGLHLHLWGQPIRLGDRPARDCATEAIEAAASWAQGPPPDGKQKGPLPEERPFSIWFGFLVLFAECVVQDQELQEVSCTNAAVPIEISHAVATATGQVKEAAAVVLRRGRIVVQRISIGAAQAARQVARAVILRGRCIVVAR